MAALFYQKMKSPLGTLHMVSDGEFLRAVAFDKNWPDIQKKLSDDIEEKSCPVLKETQKQLQEYFKGERTTFDIPLLTEGTDFQKKVWKALATVPYGKTVSYSHQAKAIKSPLSVRAVGRTNGLNQISIILPCHRVIAKSGALTGYAGGLENKEFLLALEKRFSEK